MTKIIWTSFVILMSHALGHIQMSDPPPIRSPLRPELSGEKDYSYTSPLSMSGSDFPCKGYSHDPFASVEDYTAGGEYHITLHGTATHGGGSCQIALSYDQGATFQVIKSILGNCPVALHYSFRIPEDAPRGPALLAWTWFNKIGNREMYMNCAQVTIQEAPTSDKTVHTSAKSGGMSELRWENRPTIFLANINAEGQCTTVEDWEVNFPMPGDDVEGSVSGIGFRCAGPVSFLGSESTRADSKVALSGSSSSAVEVDGPMGLIQSTMVMPQRQSPASSGLGSELPRYTSPRLGVDSMVCVPGEIRCSSDGLLFFVCSQGKMVPMGPVAVGTICQGGRIQRVV